MARSRRRTSRHTTTQRAAGLIALALPAPVQRVADTRIGSLIMLVGVPAMIVFGLLSSVFDYMTFGVLLFYLKANQQEFQTGWFMESVISATLIVLVLRTQFSIFKSRPGKYLLAATLIVVLFTLALPYLPFAGSLGFIPLPLHFYAIMLLIVILYIISAEIVKRQFYKYVPV